jgi:hypothetical protein
VECAHAQQCKTGFSHCFSLASVKEVVSPSTGLMRRPLQRPLRGPA